jgi:hypothetical protein
MGGCSILTYEDAQFFTHPVHQSILTLCEHWPMFTSEQWPNSPMINGPYSLSELIQLTHEHRPILTFEQWSNSPMSTDPYSPIWELIHSHLWAQPRPPWTCLPGPPAGWPPPSGRPRRSSRPMRASRALPPRRRPLGSALQGASAGHSCTGHSTN